MSESLWEEERTRLHAESAERFISPMDPNVEEAVIGLRLLGYETVGSCEGHMWHPDEQGPTAPFIAIQTRERPRRLATGSLSFNDPTQAPARERRYMAMLIWQLNRPLARQLQSILEDCSNEIGRPLTLCCRADRYGIAVELIDRERLTEETLHQAQQDLRDLGAYLRRRMLTEEAISVLKIARAALIYAARAVDAAEALKRKERDGLVVDLPVLPLDPFLNEIG